MNGYPQEAIGYLDALAAVATKAGRDVGTAAAVSSESSDLSEQSVRRRSVFPSGAAMRWRQVFPGAGVQLRELRCWLVGLLPDCAARADVITAAVELAANAVRHTASGQAGGFFAAEVTWYGSVVRVAVADGGGPSQPRVVDRPYSDELDGFDEHGRGLKMVEELSIRTGVIGDTRGRVVWAEVPWPAEQPPPTAVFERIHQETIATAERSLRTRFGEFLAWYGSETLQWWACPKSAGTVSSWLVSASSAAGLAELLTRARLRRLAAEHRSGHHVPSRRSDHP